MKKLLLNLLVFMAKDSSVLQVSHSLGFYLIPIQICLKSLSPPLRYTGKRR